VNGTTGARANKKDGGGKKEVLKNLDLGNQDVGGIDNTLHNVQETVDNIVNDVVVADVLAAVTEVEEDIKDSEGEATLPTDSAATMGATKGVKPTETGETSNKKDGGGKKEALKNLDLGNQDVGGIDNVLHNVQETVDNIVNDVVVADVLAAATEVEEDIKDSEGEATLLTESAATMGATKGVKPTEADETSNKKDGGDRKEALKNLDLGIQDVGGIGNALSEVRSSFDNIAADVLAAATEAEEDRKDSEGETTLPASFPSITERTATMGAPKDVYLARRLIASRAHERSE
jgi:hypothetical protein